MSALDTTKFAAPPCPVCAKPTNLKERFKEARHEGDTYFFKCTACGVEYPVHAPDLTAARPSPETP
ncbi:MAG: hypothetical protein Q7T81_06960 [Pseudolabrys sp.]|nr:hypothetical protein [Pseudolabrys sp.]